MVGNTSPEADCFAVPLRRNIGIGFEKPAEVILIGVAQFVGNFFDWFIGQVQFPFGFNNDSFGNKFSEGFIKMRFGDFCQCFGRDMKQICIVAR